MSTATRLSLLAAALLASPPEWCVQDRSEMDFPNHARLVYLAPVSPELSRTFGPGWMRLTITRPDGSTLPISSRSCVLRWALKIFARAIRRMQKTRDITRKFWLRLVMSPMRRASARPTARRQWTLMRRRHGECRSIDRGSMRDLLSEATGADI